MNTSSKVPNTQPTIGGDFKTGVESLRKTLQTQRAHGATATKMEVTIKAAGRLVIEEVKALEIYDELQWEKINIEELQNARNAVLNRLIKLYDQTPQLAEELRRIYLEVEKDFIRAKRNYPVQQLRIFTKRAEQISSIISKARSVGVIPVRLKAQFGNSSTVSALTEQALNCYSSDWIEASIKYGKISTQKALNNERGSYNGLVIKIESHYRFDVAIHELGHRMEEVIKEILDAETEFYKRRTAGDSLEKLKDLFPNGKYEDYEVTRKDKFLNAYVGKDYGGNSYELVSMGFQWAYTDPIFLLQYKDMAEWIYGLLVLI